MGIVFEPNPVKEVLNLRDHGVSFAAAQEVFDDPNHVEAEKFEEKIYAAHLTNQNY
jgi:uncharacterized DUF497 family protein